jgi:dihydrolipoamide dehydrogenase
MLPEVTVDINIGDKVSFGTPFMTVELSAQATGEKVAAPIKPATPTPIPQVSSSPSVGTYAGTANYSCQLLVLGSGPGGYSAAFRGADLGLETILIERYATLGGVCLNVGCIPSKALLHTAAVMEEVKSMAKHGVHFGEPQIDINALREHKEGVISQLTTGLAGMAKARKVKVLRGVGTFLDANHLQLEETSGTGWDVTGKKEVIHFEKVIIAAGSQSVVLPFLPLGTRPTATKTRS